MSKQKDTRPEWYGHVGTISKMCGCSKTAVSKVLNGRAEEVTSNQQLIERIRQAAYDLILQDSNLLMNQAKQKQEIARQLVA